MISKVISIQAEKAREANMIGEIGGVYA